ncbi:hypothetical protein [Modestobacter sp. SYSU DS0290]
MLTSVTRPATPSSPSRPRGHVHRFRNRIDDPFGGSVFYGCRCGLARPAL